MQACLAQEMSAGELAQASSLALPTVSEHLKVLRKCGLLVLDKQGRYWMYRTDAAVLRAAVAALAELGAEQGS